jgi:hypothetical protein
MGIARRTRSHTNLISGPPHGRLNKTALEFANGIRCIFCNSKFTDFQQITRSRFRSGPFTTATTAWPPVSKTKLAMPPQ